ncbi:hypothetical protein BDZ89DRAFT_1074757 [Hymenopellis radicata]|nr:hypothetical protein BDZ89DRAFT_1074757 [Hymenopellis radicata]
MEKQTTRTSTYANGRAITTPGTDSWRVTRAELQRQCSRTSGSHTRSPSTFIFCGSSLACIFERSRAVLDLGIILMYGVVYELSENVALFPALRTLV